MSDAVTIALHTARKRRDEGGVTTTTTAGPGARTPRFHAGPIHSGVAGRTDHLPITVSSGSYVLPADIVSAGGSGNTLAGFKVLRRTFGGEPYGSGLAPYGQNKGVYGLPVTYAAGGAISKDGSGRVTTQGGLPVDVTHNNGMYFGHVNGKNVSTVSLSDDANHVTSVTTNPDYQRRGIASAMYDHIEKHIGHSLKPSPTYTTPAGQALLAARKRRGDPATYARGGRTRAAGILFLSPEKEVLLMRRTENDGDQGKWAFPAGGIKKDETPETAARRETREESGYEHEGGLSPFMHSDKNGVDFVTYLAHSKRFNPTLNHEHDTAKWVTLDEAAKLPLHPGVKAALEKLATRAGKAHGGESSGVPIVAAGGEWVISPEHVRNVGGGDIDLGHRVLDSFVHRVRKELIGTLAKLPGPKRD